MKGTLAVPFLFLGAAVAAWGSSHALPAIWTAALAFLGVSWLRSGRIAPGISPLAMLVWAYVAWTVANTAFLSPAYNPAGLYDPMFLLAGFSIGRSIEHATRLRAFAVLAAGVAALAFSGVAEVAFGAGRAQAFFGTPNTLASVVNFALAPAVILVAADVRARSLECLVFLLFAGLCATFSRGAAIALVAGVTVGLYFLDPASVRWRPIAKIALLFFAGAVLTAAAMALRSWLEVSEPAAEFFLPMGSLSSRLELYGIAWNAAIDHLWRGVGYLGFRMVLERDRALVPSYGEANFTYFVHNDYLQVLLELGLPALVALISIVTLPFILAKQQTRQSPAGRAELAAVLATLAAVAVHALGDFPLHVPVCLLLFGLFLGTADRLMARPAELLQRWTTPAARLAQIVLAMGLATMLARPAIAELAAVYATHKWLLGDGKAAAYGFELARRFDAKDSRYHASAGQFWFIDVSVTGNPEAARRADEAFAAGMQSNPFDTTNRLRRVLTQIRFGPLLPEPASAQTLRKWADDALALAPLNPALRKEHADLIKLLEAKP